MQNLFKTVRTKMYFKGILRKKVKVLIGMYFGLYWRKTAHPEIEKKIESIKKEVEDLYKQMQRMKAGGTKDKRILTAKEDRIEVAKQEVKELRDIMHETHYLEELKIPQVENYIENLKYIIKNPNKIYEHLQEETTNPTARDEGGKKGRIASDKK